MPILPERKGQFVFSEENLTTKKTVTEEDLNPGDEVVLAESEECRIEVKIKGENEATVLIFGPGSISARHHWNPGRGEFSRSTKTSLNHGTFIDSEKRSLKVPVTKEEERIIRTVYWRETDA